MQNASDKAREAAKEVLISAKSNYNKAKENYQAVSDEVKGRLGNAKNRIVNAAAGAKAGFNESSPFFKDYVGTQQARMNMLPQDVSEEELMIE